MKNICIIVSNIDKALAFEWTADYFKSKANLHFILLNPNKSYLTQYLDSVGVKNKFIQYRGKKDLPFAILKVIFYLLKNKIQLVHTHLFDANIIGLLAAKIVGIKERIYTRHYATYHHEYFPKAVRYDRFINSLSTHIIAISKNVRDVLVEMENVKKDKITVIHHGFDLKSFEVGIGKEDLELKYNPNKKRPVIGVISRYLELKGVHFIIPAFQKILSAYPDALLILANAKGDYTPQIKDLLKQLPDNSFVEIEFENNIQALYHLFDIFIHVPINEKVEAYGQTYVEALAAGIPSIFTLSGIAPEFIKNNENAKVVDFKNEVQIFNAMIEILNNNELGIELIQNGKQIVVEMFSLDQMLDKLSLIYFKSN